MITEPSAIDVNYAEMAPLFLPIGEPSNLKHLFARCVMAKGLCVFDVLPLIREQAATKGSSA